MRLVANPGLLFDRTLVWLSEVLGLELSRQTSSYDKPRYMLCACGGEYTYYVLNEQKQWAIDKRGEIEQTLMRRHKKFLPEHLRKYQKQQQENLSYSHNWYLNQEGERLNVISTSLDWRAYCLSNFSAFPFTLDGTNYVSVEGFIQGIKYPCDHPSRIEAFNSYGNVAKQIGQKADRKFIWYDGKKISFGSLEHYRLIEKAIRAKCTQNAGAAIALQATKKLVLVHDTGKQDSSNTSLPHEIFCDILTRIREGISPKFTLEYIEYQKIKNRNK